MTLDTRILIGLVAGVAAGAAARQVPAIASMLGWVEPVGTIFIRLIGMIVVPLVAAGLFAGVASLGDMRRLGRIGGRTLAYFVVSTAIAAVIGLIVALAAGAGSGLDPAVRDSIASRFATAGSSARANISSVPSFTQTLVAIVPANPVAAAAQGDLLALIFFVVLLAAATTALDPVRRQPFVAFVTGLYEVAMIIVRWVMKLAPVAVSILIAVTVLRSGADLLASLAAYALVVVVALAIHVVVAILPAVRLLAGLTVGRFLRAIADPVLLAFSTASSNVALPSSLAAARERLGISNEVSGFILPTGTTLNKNGAAVYKAATAVFLAHVYGVELGAGQLMTIVLTTMVASSAGAGVPGSSLVTTLIVLNAIGLGANAAAGIALVAGVDRPLDMCRTAVNTLSNLAGASIVARAEGERLQAPVAAVTP